MKKLFSGFLALCLVLSIFTSNFITKAEDKVSKIILTINTSKISGENIDKLLKNKRNKFKFSKYCKRKNK